jgi:hypothetical protein
LSVGGAAFTLIGCGTSGQTGTSDSGGSQTLVQIIPEANKCPVFVQSLVIPQTIQPAATADVVVLASDPDGSEAALTFAWSASSGSFSSSDRAVTRYRCAQAGPQLLYVDAIDELGCRSELTLRVTCLGD